MICAILIGRESSIGFPGKNVYSVLGKPMMVYPILAAKGSKYVDRIYVSTDSSKIKKIAKSYECNVIDRPAELCTSEARGEDVFIHAYNIIKKELEEINQDVELLPLLMCNAPTITSEKIDEGIEVLRKNSEYDSAVTVSLYNMSSPLRARKIESDGLLHPFVPHECFGDVTKMDSDRDSQGDCWFADMGVSIIRPRNLLNINKGLLPQKWMGQKIYPLKQWGGLDVDYEWQIPLVEYWIKKHQEKK